MACSSKKQILCGLLLSNSTAVIRVSHVEKTKTRILIFLKSFEWKTHEVYGHYESDNICKTRTMYIGLPEGHRELINYDRRIASFSFLDKSQN